MALQKDRRPRHPLQLFDGLKAVLRRVHTGQAPEFPVVWRQDHRTGCAAQYIYMPGKDVYAIGVHHHGAFGMLQNRPDHQICVLALSHAAADQTGVTAAKPRQYFRDGLPAEHTVLLWQRKHHGLGQLGGHDGIDPFRHAGKDQSRAGPHRRHGSQSRRSRVAHRAAEQQKFSEIPLVGVCLTFRQPPVDRVQIDRF